MNNQTNESPRQMKPDAANLFSKEDRERLAELFTSKPASNLQPEVDPVYRQGTQEFDQRMTKMLQETITHF